MATHDKSCSIHPYFKVHEGQIDAFRSLCERFIELTRTEDGCQFYGFSFDGDLVHCRESYRDAEGLLNHLGNVGDTLAEALQISDIVRLEVHGPADELAKLKEPLADHSPQYFELEYGFRN
jgi:quinol monooxygenase YgiN